MQDPEELEGQIHDIFHPEPDYGSEGLEWHEMPPLKRLEKHHKLDTSYWKPLEYSTISPLMRVTREEDPELATIIKSHTAPFELFMGTFRLFGDSILAYNHSKERKGPYRYYPAILMSAWSAFEAYLRIDSELLVKTVPNLPTLIKHFLLEKEEWVDKKGRIQQNTRYRPIQERYWVFLKYGFGFEYDREGTIWQLADQAMQKRDELVHYKHADLPTLTTTELWLHLEAILLLMIEPSTKVKKTIMHSLYELYGMLEQLRELIEDYEERPNFKDWTITAVGNMFPCPFNNIDDDKYPDMGNE